MLQSRCYSPDGLVLALALAFSATAFAEPPQQQPIRRLSLPNATESLIAKNLAVLAARYNVDLFRAQRVAAALKPNPTIVFSANQFTIPRNVVHPKYAFSTFPDNAAANTTYTIDVEKTIERGAKRELRTDQAEIQTQGAEAQLSDALRQQTFQLKQAFLSAVLARENLRVVRDNLKDFSRTEQLLTTQVKEGYSAGVDLRRIGLELVDFQGAVSAAEQSYVQSVRDVYNLIGEGEAASLDSLQIASTDLTSLPDQELELLEGDLDVQPISASIEELRRSALANRPDLRAAQFDYAAAEAALKIAEAERVRDVTFGAQYARAGSDNAVGLSVGVPISTRARADAAIAQATAAKMQVEARLRQARAQALTDVEKAFVAYRISRDRLNLFNGQVLRNASEVRNIEQVAYREGAKGLLNFLDAQHVYNQTLVGFNQARYDVALSIYQLELAVGSALIN